MENTETIQTTNPEFVAVNTFLSKTFGIMALGLLASAVTAFITLSVPAIARIIFSSEITFFGLMILELAAVWYLSARIMTMNIATARATFFGYAVLSGLTLSVIFIEFQLTSILSIFLATAGMFGALAYYGMHTKSNLTSAGKIAFVGLIGIIIASLINMFLQSSGLDFVVSWIGVVIFSVFTAYDIQKIKHFSSAANTKEDAQRMTLLAALRLYLDFINLFLSLLRIFGKRR